MGKKRKRRCKGQALQTTAAPLAQQSGAGDHFIRFAVAFLVIYLLLMLLVTHESHQ